MTVTQVQPAGGASRRPAFPVATRRGSSQPTPTCGPPDLPAEKVCGCHPHMPTIRTPDGHGWECLGCGWGYNERTPA